jgi:hypothetical protein
MVLAVRQLLRVVAAGDDVDVRGRPCRNRESQADEQRRWRSGPRRG